MEDTPKETPGIERFFELFSEEMGISLYRGPSQLKHLTIASCRLELLRVFSSLAGDCLAGTLQGVLVGCGSRVGKDIVLHRAQNLRGEVFISQQRPRLPVRWHGAEYQSWWYVYADWKSDKDKPKQWFFPIPPACTRPP